VLLSRNVVPTAGEVLFYAGLFENNIVFSMNIFRLIKTLAAVLRFIVSILKASLNNSKNIGCN
jgi:hypothetical protein